MLCHMKADTGTPSEDCVRIVVNVIVKIATSKILKSETKKIADVLLQLFQTTNSVDFKFELARHLLDICHPKSKFDEGLSSQLFI